VEHRNDPEEQRRKYIYVRLALEFQRDAAVLFKLYKRRADGGRDRRSLWNGHYLLDSEASRCVRAAIERGQLLFCFEGTTVLQGGAA
jgi:hypothetical protein